ncbi:DUF1902 domain-containing protein [Anabaena sp. CCY 0017]|uniref:DUF1902 domain-containing protein n=1 Tax=Anabaena sp. CCY 0017 TaxID=3103866 RepID=UPI0039C66D3E
MEPRITIKVQAFWDAEASVWVADASNLPGLVTEAETIEQLTKKLEMMIPELMELNQANSFGKKPVVLDLTSHFQQPIGVGC